MLYVLPNSLGGGDGLSGGFAILGNRRGCGAAGMTKTKPCIINTITQLFLHYV